VWGGEQVAKVIGLSTVFMEYVAVRVIGLCPEVWGVEQVAKKIGLKKSMFLKDNIEREEIEKQRIEEGIY
jgi:hypothetical protein